MRDLNEIPVFLSVADLLNFDRAAHALGLSPATVSRRVTQLERRLGVALLHRTTRSVRLTSAGETYVQHCQAVLAAADQADEALAPHRNELRGDLCVNAPVLFGQRVLAAIAARFAAAHPGLRLHVELTNTHVAPVETGCDLVIRTGDLPDSSLRARLLARASFVAVATPDVIAAHGDPRDLKGLAGKPCIVFGGAKERRWRFPSAPPDPVAVTTAFTSNDLEVTRQAALSGIGFAILPRFSIADAIEDGRLRVASLSSLLQPSKLHAIFPGHPIPQAGAHAFANEVASQLKGKADWP